MCHIVQQAPKYSMNTVEWPYISLANRNLRLKSQHVDRLQLVGQQLLAKAQTITLGRSGGFPGILLQCFATRPKGRDEKVRMNGWRRRFLRILLAGLILAARPNRSQAQSSQAVL